MATTILQILFLYMSTTSHTPKVTRMAEFVMTLYAYLCFTLKYHWRETEALAILFQAIKLVQKLYLQEQQLACPVIERGFFRGHPEKIFICVLGTL